MDLDDVAVFICVVDSGSFIAASKKLKMPPSTVSRRVLKLESDLNTQLVERTSRKMHLTERGKIFYSQCVVHVRSIKESINEALSEKNTMVGKLKITVPTFLGSELLSDALTEFSKNHESIDLEIVLNNKYEDIVDEKIDFAIRVGPLKDSKYISQLFLTSHFVLCTSPLLLKKLKKIKSPSDLDGQPFILASHQSEIWDLQHRKTKQSSQMKIQGHFRSNDIGLNRSACLNGLGLAFLPELSVKTYLQSGELVRVLEDYDILASRDIYIIYLSKNYLSKKAMTLINFLKKRAEFK